ncbi:MAG TPA: Gfo/Idh/MocA family oxidoreductase [Propylenella sp.]
MKERGRLGVGLVGSGFMGRAHAFAFNAAAQVFELPLKPELAVIADRDEALAAEAARRLGFQKGVGDWRLLVGDPAVDLVAIATPNSLHRPVAIAALAAGKAVYCEKPLAPSLADARRMAEAADAAGAISLAGFQYLKNPIIRLARDMIEAGEIGEIVGFRGIHAEDYMTDPDAPFSFRNERIGGGVLLDLGSHIVALARHLAGPIADVAAASRIVHASRPSPSGPRPVETEDHAHFTARFESGAIGNFTASWVTPGRKMQLEFELVGTRGSIVFSQERFNELRVFAVGGRRGRDGFRTIVAGPDTPPYGSFCPAPGHQLGFNDLKTIEVAHLIESIAADTPASPDFREAYEVQRVIEAAIRSAGKRAWLRVADCA